MSNQAIFTQKGGKRQNAKKKIAVSVFTIKSSVDKLDSTQTVKIFHNGDLGSLCFTFHEETTVGMRLDLTVRGTNCTVRHFFFKLRLLFFGCSAVNFQVRHSFKIKNLNISVQSQFSERTFLVYFVHKN